MIDLLLLRTERTPDGTFGMLLADDGEQPMKLYTVEEDWKGNARGESCIPAGTYPLRRTIYHKHGYETFEVCDVPNRTRILLHPGNTEEDLQGCIAPGLRFGKVVVVKDEDTGELRKEKRGVVSSREAFRRFMAFMGGVDEASLTVKWAPGLP